MSDPLVQELRDAATHERYTWIDEVWPCELLGCAADALDAARQREQALRETLQRIRDVAFQSFRGGQFNSETPMAHIHRDASVALAAVPAPAATPRPVLYFAERQHPTDYGMLQVKVFTNEVERDGLLIKWKADNPALHPRGWEREVEQDVAHEIAAPSAPQE